MCLPKHFKLDRPAHQSIIDRMLSEGRVFWMDFVMLENDEFPSSVSFVRPYSLLSQIRFVVCEPRFEDPATSHGLYHQCWLKWFEDEVVPLIGTGVWFAGYGTRIREIMEAALFALDLPELADRFFYMDCDAEPWFASNRSEAYDALRQSNPSRELSVFDFWNHESGSRISANPLIDFNPVLCLQHLRKKARENPDICGGYSAERALYKLVNFNGFRLRSTRGLTMKIMGWPLLRGYVN